MNKKHNATMQSRLTDWRIIIREHRKGELSALDAEPKRRRGTPVVGTDHCGHDIIAAESRVVRI